MLITADLPARKTRLSTLTLALPPTLTRTLALTLTLTLWPPNANGTKFKSDLRVLEPLAVRIGVLDRIRGRIRNRRMVEVGMMFRGKASQQAWCQG